MKPKPTSTWFPVRLQPCLMSIGLLLANHPTSAMDRPIVFDAYHAGTNSIFRVNPDGSGLTQITSHAEWDYNPSWSPDGTRIAFRRGGNRLMVMNADGSGQRQVQTWAGWAGIEGIRWAPDQSYLVYTRLTFSDWYNPYFRINLDGTGETPFLEGFAKSVLLGFHPKQARVVWAGATGNWGPDAEVYTAPLAGGVVNVAAATRLTANGSYEGCPSYSPDGASIVFHRSDNANGYSNPQNLHLINVDGSNDRKLTSYTGSSAAWNHAWSPAGNQVVYRRELAGTFGLIVRDLATGTEQTLTTSGYNAGNPDWCWATSGPHNQVLDRATLYWDCNQSSGTTVSDSKGGNTGTLDEPANLFFTYSTNLQRYCLKKLPSTTAGITPSTRPVLSPTYTLSCWAKPTTENDSVGGQFFMMNQSAYDAEKTYCLHTSDIYYQYSTYPWPHRVAYFTANGGWHHYVWVNQDNGDGTARLRMYVDGAKLYDGQLAANEYSSTVGTHQKFLVQRPWSSLYYSFIGEICRSYFR